MAATVADCDHLVERLEVGDQMIRAAEEAGESVGDWEDHWISLLRSYEAACRSLGHTAYPEDPRQEVE